uniref:Uncharacterized protein n=1 Tax=Anopheles braziliensis TaxID=58242 RepID=A0A2M3ZLW6_9DIPT
MDVGWAMVINLIIIIIIIIIITDAVLVCSLRQTAETARHEPKFAITDHRRQWQQQLRQPIASVVSPPPVSYCMVVVVMLHQRHPLRVDATTGIGHRTHR